MKNEAKTSAAGFAAACFFAAAAALAQGMPSSVPQALAPRAGQQLVERIAARGVQVYQCRTEPASAAGAQWVFVAPKADLFDGDGFPVGRHYGGPHWEAADGSRIVGTVEARADAPQANAIPWLLLSTSSVGAEGRFARVTSIQRVNTYGGVAPVRACLPGAVGEMEEVPYTADYVLYR